VSPTPIKILILMANPLEKQLENELAKGLESDLENKR